MHQRTLKKDHGFTLIEVLVAMALVSTISLVVMGALSPWIGMKQKMDTERRLQDARQGILALYEAEAMAIESDPRPLLKEFKSSTTDTGTGGCLPEAPGFTANAVRFSESPQTMTKDGYGNPWCLRVSAPIKVVYEGVDLWFRSIAIISTGVDGTLAPDTTFLNGALNLGGDDLGVLVSGREVQAVKLKEALRRMTRIGQAYETYFTARYLANAARDVSIDYFNNAVDASGAVARTGGAWAPTKTALAGIGVSGVDAMSPWEANNNIELGNFNETVGTTVVRSPDSPSGAGILPYTALLRARVPAPSDAAPVYAVQVVVGNY